ncbi:MAG: acyclic terpene utilization AtuA family protein [Flavonifractor plautii]
MTKTIRIGSGAGYAGDRLEPSLELIEKGNLDYISYECLAERTIAIGQQAKLKDPSKGYNGLLEHRMERALPLCWKHKVKLITNMGSANPQAAAQKCVEIAHRHGLTGMKIACVTGDDLLPVIDKYMDTEVWETHDPLSKLPGEIVSANAYMGVEGILKALEQGADVVITGRVADPAIFMAPMIHEFGWSLEDWDKLGKGTIMGHLLECGGQVTGGYFAEPGKKDVPGVGHLGFPIIEVSEDGSFFVTKVPESGGMVTVETCSEQICYEIHDPENYLTPDVVADCKQITFTEVEKDKVAVTGITGKPKTETFKCSIGYKDCFIGDGEISYGGPGCVARGRLALDIIKERLELVAPGVFDELKFDLIGCNSLYWNPDFKYNEEPSEVRVRVSGRAKARADAELIGNEVEALYTNGPAGGCGAVKRTRDIVSVASILVSRCDVKPEVEIFEV